MKSRDKQVKEIMGAVKGQTERDQDVDGGRCARSVVSSSVMYLEAKERTVREKRRK